jgi:hypothetical protein
MEVGQGPNVGCSAKGGKVYSEMEIQNLIRSKGSYIFGFKIRENVSKIIYFFCVVWHYLYTRRQNFLYSTL